MADQSPHERLGESRRSVDRTGDLLRDWHRSPAVLLDPDQQDAVTPVAKPESASRGSQAL